MTTASRKCALILGASSDIAGAVTHLLASKGYKILLAGRQSENLDRMKSDLSIRHQTSVEQFYFDASQYATHEDFYKKLPSKPDVVICAFGLLGNQVAAQSDWEECNSILVSNFLGAISILNIVADDMESRGNGVIAGLSSVAGERGRQSNYFYGSAKAGLTAYLSGLRNRLYRSNVHVITIKPGFVKTKMTDGIKLPPILTARPEQVAKEILAAIENKKDVVYVLGRWRWIMLFIRIIPESIFKKLKL